MPGEWNEKFLCLCLTRDSRVGEICQRVDSGKPFCYIAIIILINWCNSRATSFGITVYSVKVILLYLFKTLTWDIRFCFSLKKLLQFTVRRYYDPSEARTKHWAERNVVPKAERSEAVRAQLDGGGWGKAPLEFETKSHREAVSNERSDVIYSRPKRAWTLKGLEFEAKPQDVSNEVGYRVTVKYEQ